MRSGGAGEVRPAPQPAGAKMKPSPSMGEGWEGVKAVRRRTWRGRLAALSTEPDSGSAVINLPPPPPKPAPIEGEGFRPEGRRPRCEEPPPPERGAAECWQSTDHHADGGSLPPLFQSHRNFRRRSSRLRKDRPHNAPPLFDNRTPRRSAQEPRLQQPKGRRCARSRSTAHVPALVAAQGGRTGIAKFLNSLTADVDSADSVDSNSGAPCGKKLLRPEPGQSTCCLLPAACPC